MTIVRTYIDSGRSGLRLAGRDGLRALLEDVATKRNDFKALLVYDVSRWGRFQDVGESAYYEFLLKKSGILIHYCAEQFLNGRVKSNYALVAGGLGIGDVSVWGQQRHRRDP
jgi:DNA invertase Pin-like site-specific DNA recombinase